MIAIQTVGRDVENAVTECVLATILAERSRAVAKFWRHKTSNVNYKFCFALFCLIRMIAFQTVFRAVEKAEKKRCSSEFSERTVAADQRRRRTSKINKNNSIHCQCHCQRSRSLAKLNKKMKCKCSYLFS